MRGPDETAVHERLRQQPDIVRQLLAESLLLAVFGTAAGVALNLLLTRLLSGVRIPTPLPIEALIQPDCGVPDDAKLRNDANLLSRWLRNVFLSQ